MTRLPGTAEPVRAVNQVHAAQARRSPTGSGPATAGGITFLNLEDETGRLNVVYIQGALPTGREHQQRLARP